MRPLRLRARWAIPVDSAVIRDAAILIGADGRIAAVGPDSAVPAPAEAESLDLGGAILIPGLVNVHTHLELTGFHDLTPDRPFREWILAIRERKQRRSPEEFLAAAKTGLRECWAAGVTTIADTGDSGAALGALAELDGSGIVYHEVFGPHPSQAKESFAGLEAQVRTLRPLARGRIRLGVSPHAPYTVSGPLYSRVAAWAGAEGLPMAVHIAESAAETEFVTRGTGPFAEAWKARAIPPLSDASHQPSRPPVLPSSRPPVLPYSRPPVLPSSRPPVSPVHWLDQHGVLGPQTLCIHAVQLSSSDVAMLAERGAKVAHCPLSNARHGHGAAPLALLLAAGIGVGIGTDSVASVGALDLMADTRAARALAGLDAEGALALATLAGAQAIGLGSEIGSLSPGKWGDVVAIDPRNRPLGSESDPREDVLASAPGDTLVTVLGGRVVHRRESQA